MANELNWGIIGTGGIAKDFAQALTHSKRCRVVNAVGSSPEKGAAFGKEWSLPRASRTLPELLADAEVQAVYVATPHPLHKQQSMACIEAGKHVLCEKPICLNAADAEAVIVAAKKADVFLMEAWMYRSHPLMKELVTRLKQGVIGPIRHLRADFGFRVPRDPKMRLFNPELGGGGILDVGGYPMSFARLLAGLIVGTEREEPTKLMATGVIGPTGVDEQASALVTFASGFTASLGCGVFHDLGTAAVIFGEAGRIELPDPWIPGGDRQRCDSEFVIIRDGEPSETVTVKTEMPTYAIEAELVLDSIPNRQATWPAMSWEDTLGNMRALDRWRVALQAD